jgi:Domain of unknown function (DUF4431)
LGAPPYLAACSESYGSFAQGRFRYEPGNRSIVRNALALAGRHVRTPGTLIEKENGHHYTDVLMDVQQVTVLD